MSKIVAGITTSVDGYITGPDDGPGCGLGVGGERLHYWVFGGPWGLPFFIVTHRPADQPEGGGFTFAGSLDEAVGQARAAAGDRQVHLMGGADLIRQ